MWMMRSKTERLIWGKGVTAQTEVVVEIFLDFDPICPDWPPDDALPDSKAGDPQQQEGSDAGQDHH